MSTRSGADIRQMRGVRVSALPTMLACLVLGGCGSSASSPPAYVAAADAICTAQRAQLDKLPQPSTATAAITYLPRAIAIMHREADQLAALRPAGPEGVQFEAAVASTRQLAGALGGFLRKLRGGVVELSTYTQMQTESGAFTAAINTHFHQAGLTRCGA